MFDWIYEEEKKKVLRKNVETFFNFVWRFHWRFLVALCWCVYLFSHFFFSCSAAGCEIGLLARHYRLLVPILVLSLRNWPTEPIETGAGAVDAEELVDSERVAFYTARLPLRWHCRGGVAAASRLRLICLRWPVKVQRITPAKYWSIRNSDFTDWFAFYSTCQLGV